MSTKTMMAPCWANQKLTGIWPNGTPYRMLANRMANRYETTNQIVSRMPMIVRLRRQ